MSKIKALVKMNNKRNYEDPALYCTYLSTMLIVVVIVAIIMAKAVIGPYSRKSGVTSEQLGFCLQNIMLGFMAGTMGICYNVMLSVPLMKDKANGNIESMLAASASVKDIWVSRTISLYIPALLTTYTFTIVTSVILKSMYIKNGFTLELNGWFMATAYIAVPLVYLSLCFLVNLIGLCFAVEISNLIGNIFGPAFAIVSINIAARKVLNPNSCALFIAVMVLAVILMVICLCMMGALNKEKIVLSCKAQAAGAIRKMGGKPHGKRPAKK